MNGPAGKPSLAGMVGGFQPSKASAEGLVLETAASTEIIDAYRSLVRAECRFSLEPGDQAREQALDARSLFLTVRHGDTCVGGARLTLRRSGDDRPLPMETDGLDLAARFPNLIAEDFRYCELTRLVLRPEFRSGSVTALILGRLHAIAAAEGTHTMFAAAPIGNVRLYRRLAAAMGLRHSQIHDDIEIPPYPCGSPIRDVLLRIELT